VTTAKRPSFRARDGVNVNCVGRLRQAQALRPNNTTGKFRMAAMRELPVVQIRRQPVGWGDAQRVTVHAKHADGFRERSSHPAR
jgi:hypothetical protein